MVLGISNVIWLCVLGSDSCFSKDWHAGGVTGNSEACYPPAERHVLASAYSFSLAVCLSLFASL
jgi:hypothetical protein